MLRPRFFQPRAGLGLESPVVFFEGGSASLDPESRSDLDGFSADFDDLPGDRWMHSDDDYRARRFGVLRLDPNAAEAPLTLLPAQSFYQAKELNRYAGGVAREFEPLAVHTARRPFLHQLIIDLFLQLPLEAAQAGRPWDVGVHLIRIEARPGAASHPTPEGFHRDGHAYASITLIRRQNVSGGVSRFADERGDIYLMKTLSTPLDTALFDDVYGLHDVTPITPADGSQKAVRDICGFSFNPAR